VKKIVAPYSEALRLTLLETENIPPWGEAVTVGDTRSMIYACDETAPRFPAASLAEYFRVVVDEMDIGKEYFALEMLGVLPSSV
jgi:hypothetical protein